MEMASAKLVPQNEKTIQFWDQLYASDATHHQEWILHPTNKILEQLYDKLPKNGPVKVLEIGCGTSTLSRSFWQYCRGRDGSPLVSVVATDVSQICIQQLRERDADLLERCSNSTTEGQLEYQTLNIAETLELDCNSVKTNSFYMILDKGCLDTFAFRSRQRGEQKGSLVETVLHNVHSLLKHGEDEAAGVYVLATPRSKFKTVLDYPGFAKVERRALGVPKAQLVESNGANNNNKKGQQEVLYMYTCYRGSGRPKVSVAPPKDTDQCSKCGISFFDFRKGEDTKGRGIKFWTRQFRGHRVHCKGTIEVS